MKFSFHKGLALLFVLMVLGFLSCEDLTGNKNSQDEKTAISLLSLGSLNLKPVNGSMANTTPINTAEYTGVIIWQKSDGEPHTGAFEADAQYKALLTLTA
jgi:hypothetical protein